MSLEPPEVSVFNQSFLWGSGKQPPDAALWGAPVAVGCRGLGQCGDSGQYNRRSKQQGLWPMLGKTGDPAFGTS